MTTNPQPTPPAGDEILTPEVAKMKPDGMRQYVPPPFNKWVCPNLEELEALADERTYSAPLGTTALLLTLGPEAGECNCPKKPFEYLHKVHADNCPAHPRNAYVKVLPGWLAGLKEKPEGVLWLTKGCSTDCWTSFNAHWPWTEWEIKAFSSDFAFAVPRHVFDALNRPDPIHDEVAAMPESKLQGEQGIAPLPCPFCGSSDLSIRGEGSHHERVKCGHCFADWKKEYTNVRTPPPVDGSGPTDTERLTWLCNNRGEWEWMNHDNFLRHEIDIRMQSK